MYSTEHLGFDPQTVYVGSRYSHVQEVQERLNFLRSELASCTPTQTKKNLFRSEYVLVRAWPIRSADNGTSLSNYYIISPKMRQIKG